MSRDRVPARVAWAAAFVALCAIVPTIDALAAAAPLDPLIHVAPARSTVQVPLPGHSTSWSIAVTNPGVEPVALAMKIDDADADLLNDVLVLEIRSAGELVLSDTIAALLDGGADLGVLAPEQSLALDASVLMPHEAGNEYQGVSSALTIRVVAVADAAFETAAPTHVEDSAEPMTTPPTKEASISAVMASTGASLGAFGVGLGVIALGLLLILVIRRRKETDRS